MGCKMPSKFYVYGGGRWREIDLNTGRVSGWASNARFLVARRGRLECARAGPILRALRDLAAGEPSRARDGPRLPHVRLDEEKRKSHQTHHHPHHHCCQHRSNMFMENGCGHGCTVPPLLPPPAPMAAPPAPASQPAAPAPAQLTTHAINDIFDQLKNDIKIPDRSSNRAATHSPHKRFALKRKRRSSSSSEDSSDADDKGIKVGTEKQEYVRTIRYQGRGRPVQRCSGNVLGVVSMADPKADISTVTKVNISSPKKTGTSMRHTTSEARRNGDITRSAKNINVTPTQKIVTIVDNSYKQLAPNEKRVNEHAIRKEDSSDDGDIESISAEKTFAYALHNNGCSTLSKRTQWGMSGGEVSKELVIDEDDVAALRAFLERYAPDVSLHQFDYDDEYKRGIFYRLNPLVLLERSAQIRQMLGADKLSLRDFASQLGLRSVSDEPLRDREHFNGASNKSGRKRKKPDRFSVGSPHLQKSPKKKESSDKKNISKETVAHKSEEKRIRPPSHSPTPPPRSEPTLNPKPPNRSKPPPPRRQSPPPPQPPTRSQSLNLPQPPPRPKLPQRKPHRGNRNGAVNEYSRAEDAAIVSWVSKEGRARLVNGNVVWRQLETQFEPLTGHARTWQSLRNRYLRYILSSLSSLDVPPGQAARLRADAAAGSLKRKQWPARRNSIFGSPAARGAGSRRPRPPDSPQHQDAENMSPEEIVRSLRSSSYEIPKRATRASSGKPMRSRSSSSSDTPTPPKYSSPGKLKKRRLSSSLTSKTQPMRSSAKIIKGALHSPSPKIPTKRATRKSIAKLTETRDLSSKTTIRARRLSSPEPQSRPGRLSERKMRDARRSSSFEPQTQPSRSSASKITGTRRSSSSEPQIRPTRSSAKKTTDARHSLSSEPQTRPSRSSAKKLTSARRSSSSEPRTRPSRSSAKKITGARRSSSSEPQIRPTRSSARKTNGARRSSSYEKPKRVGSSSEDSTEGRYSLSSSSSVSLPRGPNLRYSDVTRRFARKQLERQRKDSSSVSSVASPPPVARGPRSRRLFNPKAAL